MSALAIDEPVVTDPTDEAKTGGTDEEATVGGCLSDVDGTIERIVDRVENADSPTKIGVSITRDSLGNHYLMGNTGFEPVTSAV